MGIILYNIGYIYYVKCKYKKSINYLKRSLDIHKKIGFKQYELITMTILYLIYMHLSKEYDVNEIYRFIKVC